MFFIPLYLISVHLVVLMVLVSEGRGLPVLFDYENEKKDKHPGKRALLVPHIIPYSSEHGVLSLKDELLLLGSAVAIIKSKTYDELTILYKYSEPRKEMEVERFHREVLHSYIAQAQLRSMTIRSAQLESNHSFSFWKDADFRFFAGQYDASFFVGADQYDGGLSCLNTHHKLRLLYEAAKASTAAVLSVDFHRRKIEGCAPTLRLMTALMRSIPCVWTMRDAVAMAAASGLVAGLERGKEAATKFRVGADVAFLSPSPAQHLTPKIERVISKIELDRLVSRKIVGVNINLHSSRLGLLDPIKNAVVRSLIYLQRKVEKRTGITVVYIPFDYKREQNDIAMARIFSEQLISECKELKTSMYTFGNSMLNSLEVKEVLRRVDLLLTTRFYLGVAAASVETPFLILAMHQHHIAYTGDMLRLGTNISCPDKVAVTATSLSRFIMDHWFKTNQYRQALINSARQVETLAMNNVLEIA